MIIKAAMYLVGKCWKFEMLTNDDDDYIECYYVHVCSVML